MQASQTKLQEIIEGTKQYVVPLFQRPYSWQKLQWEQLWNDIMELTESEYIYPHFLGSIVTMQTDSLPQGVSKYLLIDGQQRLTTIFILLATLRDQALFINKPKLAGEIHDKFLVNQYEEDFEYFKLQPTQIDREFFHEIIDQKEDNLIKKETKNYHSLTNCYLFFQRKVKRFDETKVKQIKNIICEHLIIVSILLGKDDNPYLVFESLNAKGQPLTQADLIRNYLLMGIEAKKQDKIYQQYWLPVQNLLEENLTEFLRHYLTRKGIEVKKNEVYFVLKEQVNQHNVTEYLKSIYKFALHYIKFLNPEKEDNKIVRKYLQRIKDLDVKTVYPFFLNCYDDWREDKLTDIDFIQVCKIIENYILRRFVCNIQTRGLNRIFTVLYSQVTKEANLKSLSFLEQLKLNLQIQDYPLDIEFK